jgi:hypothetical protein
MATRAKIKLGVIVHTISITLPCVVLLTKLFLLFPARKSTTTRTNKYKTKKQTITKKNIISWCKSTMPFANGVAPS